jgi:anaerobic magnesium-protoporphyrin IX monomethyl ester cyclase
MNKGELTSKEGRRAILQDAFDADIWNYLFIMLGFPSETREEALETIEFLYRNRHIASYSKGGEFVLLDKAAMLNDLSRYSISIKQKVRNGFSYAYRYETSSGMSSKELMEFRTIRDKELHLDEFKYQNSWYREKLFLYICKNGAEAISKLRDTVWI